MTSLVDIWRAVDPDAGLLSGASTRLGGAVRTVSRMRATSPYLPDVAEGCLLVADARSAGPLDALLAALPGGDLHPVGVMLAGARSVDVEGGAGPTPILASDRPATDLVDAAQRYLADVPASLARMGAELRLLCAETTLAEPVIGTPAGLVATRIHRGVAVSVDGELRALHERHAGRALAARFAAVHRRLLSTQDAERGERRRQTREGLWLLERRIRPGASVWLFDDVPFAAVDEVAADAVASTLRALLRRPAQLTAAREQPREQAPPGQPATTEPDSTMATLLAVARANGRVSPAARELGVHRNTVLYRLRRVAHERGLDPRRPADALRLLADAERAGEGAQPGGMDRARRPQ